MSICLIVLLAAVGSMVYAAVFAVRICRGRRMSQLARLSGAAVGGDVGHIGISVIVPHPEGVEEVVRLAGVQYPRMEIVVTADSQSGDGVFGLLKSRFAMIGVNYARVNDLAPQPVRGLYRSRRRCYRKIVLVDTACTGFGQRCDAAAAVAVCDYLLVLPSGARLGDGAIERLVIEAAKCPPCSVAEISSTVGIPVSMTALETVVERGGFSRADAGEGFIPAASFGRIGEYGLPVRSGSQPCSPPRSGSPAIFRRIDEPLAMPAGGDTPSRWFVAAALLSAVVAAAAADTAVICRSWGYGAITATIAALWLITLAAAERIMCDTGIWTAAETLLHNFYNNFAFIVREYGKILLSLLTEKPQNRYVER